MFLYLCNAVVADADVTLLLRKDVLIPLKALVHFHEYVTFLNHDKWKLLMTKRKGYLLIEGLVTGLYIVQGPKNIHRSFNRPQT